MGDKCSLNNWNTQQIIYYVSKNTWQTVLKCAAGEKRVEFKVLQTNGIWMVI